METLGERIKEVRCEKRITQKMLAQKSGISTKMLRNYERGHNEPGAAALGWLAQTLGVSADWLLGLEESPPAGQTPCPPSVRTVSPRR